MKELDGEKILLYVVGVMTVAILAPVIQKAPRTTRGTNVLFHIGFAGAAILLILLIPSSIKSEFFSPGGVVVVGTFLPVYLSIVAICTPGEQDDTAMLVYWIVSGTFNYLTEFIDEIKEIFPSGGDHWYEFEFFVTLWLLFPSTDGAALIYDKIIEKYLAPTAKQVAKKVEGWVAVILTLVNTTYLSFAWWVFMFLPENMRRFMVVVVGTVYPIAASTVAVTTHTEGQDDTFWLTYWSSFSLLFVAMDYLENFVGSIPGFYSVCMAATLYLFLPMFDGANVVFRRVLVPLSGQYENMLLHDAYLVRKGMEASIPEKYHDRVFTKAANVFTTRSPAEKTSKKGN